MARRPSTEGIIKTIENIRVTNNSYWMDILRIAMVFAPQQTRKVLKDISKNDKEIDKWLDKL